MSNEMIYYEERHTLLMECFETFFRYIIQLGGAFDSIHLPLMGQTVPFPPTSMSNCTQTAHKMQDFEITLSV